MESVSFIQLVTGIAMKLWLWGNMLSNIKTWEKRWNYSKKLRIVASKLLELTILMTKSINLKFFILILCSVGVCCDRRWFSIHKIDHLYEKTIHKEVYDLTFSRNTQSTSTTVCLFLASMSFAFAIMSSIDYLSYSSS